MDSLKGLANLRSSTFGARVAANIASMSSSAPQTAPAAVIEANHSAHYADHCYTLGELKTRVAEHRCIIGGRERGRKGFESSKGDLVPAQARDYMGYIVACITHAVPPGDWAFRITLRELKSVSIVVRMVRCPCCQRSTSGVCHFAQLSCSCRNST